jgi:glycosyltransferase involved in cell wall biosynthesis
MKIAFVGNLNNNNFAMMRYFRDLGADAHLLLNSDDGQGTLSHFKPECDTWEIDRWRPFIHPTSIPNAPIAGLDLPLSWLMSGRAFVRSQLGAQEGWVPPVSRRQIRAAYAGYDRLVGSGITPAALHRAGRPLDLFYPYAMGVEYLRTGEFTAHFDDRGVGRASLYRAIARRQAAGIRSARHVVNAEASVTEDVLREIGVTPVRMAIPMVYNGNSGPRTEPNDQLKAALTAIDRSDFTVMHHARMMWKRRKGFTAESWARENKNSDWLLRAFARLSAERPAQRPLLLLVEYGPDVEATRRLAQELGITDQIHWLPKMHRREIMFLLSKVSVACGEYYQVPRMIWGGTGWEALASGRPLLQGFNFAPGEFNSIYGYPPPPLLPVSNETDVYRHLLDMADNPGARAEMGTQAAAWFERYNGRGLAKQWLDLLTGVEGHPRRNPESGPDV